MDHRCCYHYSEEPVHHVDRYYYDVPRYEERIVRKVRYDYEGAIREASMGNEELRKLLAMREDEIKVLQSEIQTFRADHEKKVREEDDYEKNFRDADQRIIILTEKIRDAQIDLRNIRGGRYGGELERLLAIKSNKEREHNDLKAYLERLQNELALVKDDGHKLKLTIEEKETAIREFEDDHEARRLAEKQEIEQLEDSIDANRKEAEKIDAKIGEEDRRIRELTIENRDIEILEEEIKVRKDDSDHLKNDLQTLRQEVLELREKSEQIEQEHAQNQHEINEYESHNKAVHDNNSELVTAINRLVKAEDNVRLAPDVYSAESYHYGRMSLRGLFDLHRTHYHDEGRHSYHRAHSYGGRHSYNRAHSLGRRPIVHQVDQVPHTRYLSSDRVVERDPEIAQLYNRRRVDLRNNRVYKIYESGHDTWNRPTRYVMDRFLRRHHCQADDRHDLGYRVFSYKNHNSVFNQLLGYRHASEALHRRQDSEIFELANKQREERLSMKGVFNQYSKHHSEEQRQPSGASRVFSAAANAAKRQRESNTRQDTQTKVTNEGGRRVTTTTTTKVTKTGFQASGW
ncbi:unnamed protein product [Moneuplotes crassus]|uniref:Uncharacterized protein n=1 Tax=Euplotes crassus TaxID=5936 RepID=A0AAD1X8L8_EUPCR|nr:unnamed protein product [Moneuplotes crassus]